ncbi:MAG: tetraacyldisaccharide 4'-kinase [Candidatus Aminicenantes bacterium]|jgi:tetraacyldisaccharide 4'-kinase
MNCALRFLSLFYQAGCQVKNALYRIGIVRSKKGPLAVVSVGNISFGGTEKTPFVLALVDAFLKKGFKPAVITRGYKGKWERSGGILSDEKSPSATWTESGDEPFMISLNYPKAGVFIGKNRRLSCYRAHDMGFDVAVLDDGFQHRRLHRDIDIVLYDPSADYLLREPLSSLARADILLLKNNAGSQPRPDVLHNMQGVDIFSYSVSVEGFYDMDRAKTPESEIKDKRALAFCGIARPERFLKILEHAGIVPIHFIAFPDHFPYPSKSVKKIIQHFDARRAEVCLTTEKDAVKIGDKPEFRHIPTFYLKIGIQIEGDLFTKIFSTLKGRGLADV